MGQEHARDLINVIVYSSQNPCGADSFSSPPPFIDGGASQSRVTVKVTRLAEQGPFGGGQAASRVFLTSVTCIAM